MLKSKNEVISDLIDEQKIIVDKMVKIKDFREKHSNDISNYHMQLIITQYNILASYYSILSSRLLDLLDKDD